MNLSGAPLFEYNKAIIPLSFSMKSDEIIFSQFSVLSEQDYLRKQRILEQYDSLFLNFVENHLNNYVLKSLTNLANAEELILFLNCAGDYFISKILDTNRNPDTIQEPVWKLHISRTVRRSVYRCAKTCIHNIDDTLKPYKKLNNIITNITEDSFSIFVECVNASVDQRNKLKVPEVKTDNV